MSPASTRIPAVLYFRGDPAGSTLTVASLTTVERLIVAVYRAGCHPIHVVADGPLPPLRRLPALGVAFSVNATAPTIDGRVFVADARVLLIAAEVKNLIAKQGRLTLGGQALPAGVAAAQTGSLERDLAGAPAVEAIGATALVADAASASAASHRLWASLTSASDGLVDRHFNRPVGRVLSKLLVRTAVTPNQISVAATMMGVVSAVCFAMGTRWSAIAGAVLLQISAIIDCVDGDVARAVFKESPLGKWLDIVGDQVVHIGVFVAIGLGLWRAGVDGPVLALAISAGVGVALSFGVILRTMLQPARHQNSALQRLIDATANRDFSVLLLALALTDRVGWFLWMAGFGVHVFWVLALSLQLSRRESAPA